MKKIHLNRAQNGQRKTLFFLAAKKKKLTILFALLCACMMSWAAPVEGSSTENMDGQPGFTNGYDYSFSTEGTSVIISFTEKENYEGLLAYLWNYTTGFAETGMTVSGHTASITLTGQTPGATLDFACKFAFSGGMSVTKRFTYTVEDTGGGSGDPDPTPVRVSECFGAKGHFGNPSVKNVYYQIDYEDNKAIINLISLTGNPLDFAEVHIAGVGNYAMTANGTGGYSYTIENPTVDAEWYLRFLYSDTNMPGNEMTSENVNSSDPNIIYYVVGACTSTVTENANIALATAGSSATASTGNGNLALDDNITGGSRWESASEDPQWICVDFGARKKFNSVQLVHEGAYIKTYDIQVSDDGTNFTTIKHVSETLASFPYEQSIELGFDYAAQYMRIYGTERGTGYGYSLWELRAMYSGASTLTTITLSATDNRTLVGGAGVVMTATPKDQKGNPMVETVEYEITPAAAGHMDGNTYIPDQVGMASIVAFNGSIRSAAVPVLGVSSANLALSTNIATDNKIIAQSEFAPNGTDAFHAVDGDMGNVWQGSPTNGNVNDSREYDCWFVVDLGAFYNIDLVALHFEGACSELYHIDFSENNSDWNLGYNLVGAEGINARNDYWTELDNNIKVRYVRFWSTKAATGYGMKMHEFEVYGTEWTSGDEEKPVMVSADLVSSTINSAVIAVSATDNDEVARYHVVDGANGIDANFTPSEGKITINGLTHSTTYNFTITAKDASNNESANSIVVSVTTPFDVTFNLALNQPCEGGYYDNNPAESADKANDGNNGTSWVTYGDHAIASDWWIVDLGQVYNLTNITALWANDAYATQYMLQARVEAPATEDKADDAAWVTLATVSSVTAGEERSTDVSGVGRYVRFRALAHTGFFRLREFRVFGSGVATADTEAPVMSSASLVSNTDVQAIMAVAATDNQGIASFHVVDEVNSFDANFVAEAGNITVTGLTGGTNYNFTITAIDFFGNESANSKSVEVTTTAHYTEPQAACPAPTWDASLVKAIYSPTYSADCGFDAWESGSTAADDTYGKKYTVGNGYFGMVDFTLNCLLMKKLHFDIWVADDMTIRFVPIWGGAEQGITKTLVGQQWNSIDIDLTEYTGITNWSNITQMKLDHLTKNVDIWVANAYFYRETAYVDGEAPTNASASKVAEGFYSVQISAQAEDNSGAVTFKVKNGDVEVATGAAASAVATIITINNLTPGTNYNFSVVASDEAGNEVAPVPVAAQTKAIPAPAPVPDFRAKQIVPVFTDATTCVVTGIRSGGWGETTTAQWLDIAANDKVFYVQNLNFAGWHSWGGGNINATGMQYLHVDVYSIGATSVSVTPISPGHEGSATITLTPNAWTSYDVPLSAYDANNIDWANIFQFKFMGPVDGNELMIDNVYFWKAPKYTRDDSWMDPGELGTVCYPEGLVVTGATMYQMAGTDANGKFVFDEVDVLEPGVPYLFEAHADTLHFYATDATPAATAGTSNGMVGTFADKVIPQNSPNIYYFSGTKFYAVTARSTDLDVPANRAYVDLTTPHPAGAPRAGVRRVVFDVQGSNAATGFGEVQGDDQQSTKVLINGHLFIRRGEKTYDATGRLVK